MSGDDSQPVNYMGLIAKEYLYDDEEGIQRRGHLVDMIHATAKHYAYLMTQPALSEDYAGIIWSSSDSELNSNIGASFLAVFNKLETSIGNGKAAGNMPTKSVAREAFSAMYHALNPDSKKGARARNLIEEAFVALELGDIPQSKFAVQRPNSDVKHVR